MPELPEVETIVRELDARLTGRRLGKVRHVRSDVVHGDPRPLGELLPGRKVRQVHRRAKRVMIDLGEPYQLIFHLGMSGNLTVVSPTEPVAPHTHLRLTIRGTPREELRFRDPRRFGGIWCLTGGRQTVGRRLGPLGIEPLEASPARFRQILARKRQIKALLLDQTTIAGIGNIYADEALHAAGVHPLTKAEHLDANEAGRLLRSIKSTLRRAIRSNGSTLKDYRRIDGRPGSFQDQHRVYGRSGKPCQKCGTIIESIVAAGRTTTYCPACQVMDGG